MYNMVTSYPLKEEKGKGRSKFLLLRSVHVDCMQLSAFIRVMGFNQVVWGLSSKETLSLPQEYCG
jgi:hypothetical protein